MDNLILTDKIQPLNIYELFITLYPLIFGKKCDILFYDVYDCSINEYIYI